MSAFDVAALRRDFPILGRTVHGRPLTYLDNAATSQKPAVVIEALRRYCCWGKRALGADAHRLQYICAVEDFFLQIG